MTILLIQHYRVPQSIGRPCLNACSLLQNQCQYGDNAFPTILINCVWCREIVKKHLREFHGERRGSCWQTWSRFIGSGRHLSATVVVLLYYGLVNSVLHHAVTYFTLRSTCIFVWQVCEMQAYEEVLVKQIPCYVMGYFPTDKQTNLWINLHQHTSWINVNKLKEKKT
jgi:hypothetical protein